MKTTSVISAFFACICGSWLAIVSDIASAADVAIVHEGRPVAAVFVPERLLDDAAANPEPASVWRSSKAEDNRRRLRESVRDFVEIVSRISGAKLEVVRGAPGADEKRLPILVGELAAERFGKVGVNGPMAQGFRLVVRSDAIGVFGESDLATSYALYTLLDRLGCRWYMPSSLGECLPRSQTVAWPEHDASEAPYTVYRGLWYCDNEFARRNRLGGMELSAGHALEMTVPKSLRETNPDIRAIIGGQPQPHKIKWTHPRVAQAIAEACLAAAEKDPNLKSWSLSPDDGIGWDESDDAKLDAGDFDPAAGVVSKTDRLMVLANRVAHQVGQKRPDIVFGILAYADYVRPPVREKVHPAVVPQIAPITYSRAHPMTDPGEPNNAALRHLVEGWGKAVPATSYYFYGFNLAEVSCPNPMITKWSVDIPIIYAQGKCRYWQPETITNFESCLHAHYLGMRMAWNPRQSPAEILDELHGKFYGHAAREMAAYWAFIDEVWVKTPEYSGCGFGHLRRWPLAKLDRAQELIRQAVAACATPVEKQRVTMAAESLEQFRRFMALRRDLAEGRFENLARDAEAYRQRAAELGETNKPQYAFAQMGWTGPRTLIGVYFDAFYKATYDDATRMTKTHELMTKSLLRNWRFHTDPDHKGQSLGWQGSDFDDASWKSTDCAIDTWSALGLHNFMGTAWYRTKVELPELPAGRRMKLWISATDGRLKVFVNGKHVSYVNDKNESADSFSGFCQPVTFDITDAVRTGANQVTLECTREFLNELGTGGLLGPVAVFVDRAK